MKAKQFLMTFLRVVSDKPEETTVRFICDGDKEVFVRVTEFDVEKNVFTVRMFESNRGDV